MIVYVEDNPFNQRLFQRMLSKRDICVDIQPSYEDGYKSILEKKPDIIFVDYHIRGKHTGLDLVLRLREEHIKTPIVIVTIFATLTDKKRAIASGCNHLLSKPYGMTELLQLVDLYIPNNLR